MFDKPAAAITWEYCDILHKRNSKNITSWWLNQPIWKVCSSKWESSPRFGVNIKNVWNHQPESPKKWMDLWIFPFWKYPWNVLLQPQVGQAKEHSKDHQPWLPMHRKVAIVHPHLSDRSLDWMGWTWRKRLRISTKPMHLRKKMWSTWTKTENPYQSNAQTS